MPKKLRQHPKFTGVYTNNNREKLKIYTLNFDKGRTIYGEKNSRR